MSYLASPGNSSFPAPCIVDNGLVVNKQDIQRLLADLGHVRYWYHQGDVVLAEGEGWVIDIFADTQQSTLVANASLYLNVCSFDYLELMRSPNGDVWFNLVQDNRILRLMPLSNPVKHQRDRAISITAIEAMIADVLSANLDMRLDSGENLSF